MILWVWIGIGVAAATGAFLAKRLHAQKVPDLSDDDFINEYLQKFEGNREAIIRERRFIGQSLGWPQQKLHPDQTFRDLSERAGVDVGFEVGLSNLEDRLRELSLRAQTHAPSFPDTVGQLISAFIRMKTNR